LTVHNALCYNAAMATRMLQKTLIPSTSSWMEVPIDIHQDLDLRQITMVEVLGDTGQVVLWPVDGQPGVVKTLDGSPEPTTIDFNRLVYACPLGVSTFKLVERKY